MKVDHSPNTVQVTVRVWKTVVVDNDVDTLDVDTTTEDISGTKDMFLEHLQYSVAIYNGRSKTRSVYFQE